MLSPGMSGSKVVICSTWTQLVLQIVRTAQLSMSSNFASHRKYSSLNRSLMSTPLIIESQCSQPTRLVFISNLHVWAKLRQLPNGASAVSGNDLPLPDSGRAIIMSDDPSAGRVAADLTRLELRDLYLRKWRFLGGIRQRAIILPFCRTPHWAKGL